jgi:hypothetical protein
MHRLVSMGLVVVVVCGGALPALAQSATPSAASSGAAEQSCEQLVQGSGMTEQGRKGIQELMGSGRAPQLMDRMMQLAKGLGNGDTVAGMERAVSALEKGGGVLGGLLK